MYIQLTKSSKVVAFAEDLILAIRNETVRGAENTSNIEMSIITAWRRNNKINFNEDKSKVMIISRRKRKGKNNLSKQQTFATGVNDEVFRHCNRQQIKNQGKHELRSRKK